MLYLLFQLAQSRVPTCHESCLLKYIEPNQSQDDCLLECDQLLEQNQNYFQIGAFGIILIILSLKLCDPFVAVAIILIYCFGFFWGLYYVVLTVLAIFGIIVGIAYLLQRQGVDIDKVFHNKSQVN
ncbi:hypothetical protein pb186bvf_019689 [Paramecium bursaria]